MKLINFLGGLGMSLISGIVNSIEDGVVKTGHFAGSAFKTVVLTTGNRLTCFDTSFITGLEVGKEYTFPVEQKGQYVNIVGAVTPVIQQEGVVPGVTGTDEYTTPQVISQEIIKPAEEVLPKVIDKDVAIRKAVALKASVEFLVGQTVEAGDKFSIGDVIETAKKFEEYLA